MYLLRLYLSVMCYLFSYPLHLYVFVLIRHNSSLYNMSTTIGENILLIIIIYRPLNQKIYIYVNRNVDMNVKYTANAIQDVCEMRNIHNFELFDPNTY